MVNPASLGPKTKSNHSPEIWTAKEARDERDVVEENS